MAQETRREFAVALDGFYRCLSARAQEKKSPEGGPDLQ